MAQRYTGRKRQRGNQRYDPEMPLAKRAINPGAYAQGPMNKTSSYPMYKYVSPIAKKLLPGPNVKKTEYHAVVNYPQSYPNTNLFGGPPEDGADVPATQIKGSLYPHIASDMRAQCLTMCSQGNSSSDRTGNAVDAKGIQLYVTLQPPPFTIYDDEDPAAPENIAIGLYRPTGVGNGPLVGYPPSYLEGLTCQFRVVVLLDKDFTGGIPPRLSEVFSDAALVTAVPGANYNNYYSTNCQLRPDATQRFLVVMNKMVTIPNIGGIKTIKKNIKLDGTEIRYVNGAAAALPINCAQNTLWLFVLCDWHHQNPLNPGVEPTITVPTYSYTSRFRFLPK